MSVLKYRNPETGKWEPIGMGKSLIKSITVTGTTSATSGNLNTGLTNENCVPLYATTPDDYVVYPVDATGNVAIHVRLYNGNVATSRELTATLYYLTPEVAGAMSLDEIGTLSNLATTDKSTLVNAVNEVITEVHSKTFGSQSVGQGSVNVQLESGHIYIMLLGGRGYGIFNTCGLSVIGCTIGSHSSVINLIAPPDNFSCTIDKATGVATIAFGGNGGVKLLDLGTFNGGWFDN